MLIISIPQDFLMNKVTEEQGYHSNGILCVFIMYGATDICIFAQKITSTNKIHFFPRVC